MKIINVEFLIEDKDYQRIIGDSSWATVPALKSIFYDGSNRLTLECKSDERSVNIQTQGFKGIDICDDDYNTIIDFDEEVVCP